MKQVALLFIMGLLLMQVFPSGKIVNLEEQIEATRKNKIKAVKNQNFESAASYRDKEKELLDLKVHLI